MTKRTAIRNISAILGAVLIIYVASIGPVVAYCILKNKPSDMVNSFYYPLGQWVEASPTVSRAFDAYVEFSANLWMKCGLKTIYSTNDVVN